MAHPEKSSEDLSALKSALLAVKTLLKVLGQTNAAHADEIAGVFSDTISFARLQQLLRQFGEEDFSELPKVAICSRDRLSGMRSSYRAHNDTIYIAEDFLRAATELQLVAALLEGLVDAIEACAVAAAKSAS